MRSHASLFAYRAVMPDPGLRRRWRNRWYRMMKCCYDTSYPKYQNYGGRGITVAKRWHDVLCFLADIQSVPGWNKVAGEGLEIDRVDNNRGYQPGNVQVVTKEVNNGHKTTTHHVRSDGRCATQFKRYERLKAHKSTVTQWVKKGLTAAEIRERDRACTARTGNIRDRHFIAYEGDLVTVSEFRARARLPVSRWSVYEWAARGLSADQIVARSARRCCMCQTCTRGYLVEHENRPYCLPHIKAKLGFASAPTSLANWVKRGLSLEEMLAQDKKVVHGQGNSRAYIFFDYHGERLCPSALCTKAKLFVPFKTVARWAREGYNLEQILVFDELRRQGKNRPRA